MGIAQVKLLTHPCGRRICCPRHALRICAKMGAKLSVWVVSVAPAECERTTMRRPKLLCVLQGHCTVRGTASLMFAPHVLPSQHSLGMCQDGHTLAASTRSRPGQHASARTHGHTQDTQRWYREMRTKVHDSPQSARYTQKHLPSARCASVL